MAINKRYISGFIISIPGQVDIKWGVGQEMDNNSFIKPIKKSNRSIKIHNE